MKMYILIKESVPLGFALVASAHASLAAYLKFKDSEEMKKQLSGSFYKTICKVNDKEFENAKQIMLLLPSQRKMAKKLSLLLNLEKYGLKNLNFFGYINN